MSELLHVERRTTDAEEAPIEDLFFDAEEAPLPHEYALNESVTFWNRRLVSRLAEARSQKMAEQVRKSIDDSVQGNPSPTALAVISQRRVRTPALTERVAVYAENMWRKHVEQVRDPEAMRGLASFLDTYTDHFDIRVVDEDDFAQQKKKKFDARVVELRRQGYDEDWDQRSSTRTLFRKRLRFGANVQERKAIDELNHSLEHPREALMALKAVGVQLSHDFFSTPEAVKQVCALARAVEGVEDVLSVLGNEGAWTKSVPSVTRVEEFITCAQANRHALEQLRDSTVRKKLLRFLQHQKFTLIFTDLPVYASILSTPDILDSIEFLPEPAYVSEWTRMDSVESLQFVDAAGGSELFKGLADIGFTLNGDTLQRFKQINQSYDIEQDSPALARSFVESLRQASEGILSEEGKSFIADLKALDKLVTVDTLGEVKQLLPFRSEALALCEAAEHMHPAFAFGLSLKEMLTVVTSPERLATVLNPEYAQFIHRLFALGFLADPYYIRSECLGIRTEDNGVLSLYNNTEVRKALVGEPHVAEFFQALRSQGIEAFQSYTIAPSCIALTQVAREGAIEAVAALRRNGTALNSFADLVYVQKEIHVLCSPEYRATLSDPRLATIVTRMRQLSVLSGEYITPAQMVCEAASLITGGADVTAFEDEQKVEYSKVFLEVLRQHGVRIECSQPQDLLKLDESSVRVLADYVDSIVDSERLKLTDFLLFAKQRTVVDRGLARMRVLKGEEWKARSAQTLYEIGSREDWSSNTQVLELLARRRESSAELIAALFREHSGFLELSAIVEQVDSLSLIELGEPTIFKLLPLIPYLATIKEVIEDYPQATSLPFADAVISVESLARLQSIDRTVRQEAFRHLVDPNTREVYWTTMLKDVLGIAAAFSARPDILAELNRRFGPDWVVRGSEIFTLLDEGDAQAILDQTQAFAEYGLPADVTHVPEAQMFVAAHLQPVVEGLRHEFGYQLSYKDIKWLAEFAHHAPQDGVVGVVRQLNADFGLTVDQIIHNPLPSIQVFLHVGIREAVVSCRTAGVNVEPLEGVLENFEEWKNIAESPGLLSVLIELNGVIPFNAYHAESAKYLVGRPEVVEYIKTTLEDNRDDGQLRDLTLGIVHTWTHLHTYHEVVSELESLNFAFTDVFRYSSVLRTVLDWRHPDKWSILRQVQESSEQISLVQMEQYIQFVESDRWEQFSRARQVLRVKFSEVLSAPGLLSMMRVVFDQGVESESMPRTEMVERQLNVAQVFREVFARDNWKIMDDAGSVVANERGELVPVSEYFQSFAERYRTSDKGKTILTLLAAREYRGQPFTELVKDVAAQALTYEAVLQRGDPARIPRGFRASLGMEYEITGSTARGYYAVSGEREMRNDISRMSSYAGIPRGNDAYYEIAAAPTDNPYAMLLEMRLLQDLGYIDFNFATEGYARGSHGFHLTLGGEKGIAATQHTHALQNMLVMTGWAGVNVGNEISGAVSGGRGVSLRERGFDGAVQLFSNRTNATELRALSIDQWEPFERTVLTAHLGAVAIQVTEHCVALPRGTSWEVALAQLSENFPASPAELIRSLSERKWLRVMPLTEKERDILYAWVRAQVELVGAVRQHNTEFLDTELYGYEDAQGVWVEPESFGGGYNKSRFESVVNNSGETHALSAYAHSLAISQEQLFSATSVELVNALTRTSNLFLKPSIAEHGDLTNATAVLQTTKMSTGEVEPDSGRGAQRNVFDKGPQRTGYYAYQGGSERMIIHASQRIALRFQEEMHRILFSQQQTSSLSKAA